MLAAVRDVLVRIKYAIASADIGGNYADDGRRSQVIYRKTSLRNMWHVHFACHKHTQRVEREERESRARRATKKIDILTCGGTSRFATDKLQMVTGDRFVAVAPE